MWFEKGFTNKTRNYNGSSDSSFHKPPIDHPTIEEDYNFETNCESYLYVNFGGYTGAILVGLRNHNVAKFYRSFMVKYNMTL